MGSRSAVRHAPTEYDQHRRCPRFHRPDGSRSTSPASDSPTPLNRANTSINNMRFFIQVAREKEPLERTLRWSLTKEPKRRYLSIVNILRIFTSATLRAALSSRPFLSLTGSAKKLGFPIHLAVVKRAIDMLASLSPFSSLNNSASRCPRLRAATPPSSRFVLGTRRSAMRTQAFKQLCGGAPRSTLELPSRTRLYPNNNRAQNANVAPFSAALDTSKEST